MMTLLVVVIVPPGGLGAVSTTVVHATVAKANNTIRRTEDGPKLGVRKCLIPLEVAGEPLIFFLRNSNSSYGGLLSTILPQSHVS